MFKGSSRERTVKVTLQFGSVVRGAMVIDRKHRIAIGAHNGHFGTHRDSYKPSIVGKYPHKLGARVVDHRALPQIVGGFIQEKRGAGPTISIWAEPAGQVETAAHARGSLLPVRTRAGTRYVGTLLRGANV